MLLELGQGEGKAWMEVHPEADPMPGGGAGNTASRPLLLCKRALLTEREAASQMRMPHSSLPRNLGR